MKTKILITSVLLVFGLLIQPMISKAETTPFEKAISKNIKYPTFASENGLEGTVWVSLEVLEDGTVKVKDTNHACCEKLHKTVIKQLDGKKMKKFDSSMVGEHHVKIVFNIE